MLIKTVEQSQKQEFIAIFVHTHTQCEGKNVFSQTLFIILRENVYVNLIKKALKQNNITKLV